MSDGVSCSIEGCGKDAKRGGLCWGHRKRKAREQRLTELGHRIDGKGKKARWARIERAAVEFADDTERPVEPGEDSRRAYTLAKEKYRQALRRYFAELMPAVYRFELGAGGRLRFWRRDKKKGR